MEKEKQLVIESVQWTEEAAGMLAASCVCSSVEDYRRAVEEGAVLFRVSTAEEVICFYILRVEAWALKKVGVIVAAAAKPGHTLADDLMEIIERQFIGVDEIIQYCSRPGMVRKLAASGWESSHYVMRKVIKNG